MKKAMKVSYGGAYDNADHHRDVCDAMVTTLIASGVPRTLACEMVIKPNDTSIDIPKSITDDLQTLEDVRRKTGTFFRNFSRNFFPELSVVPVFWFRFYPGQKKT